jgi:type IV secretion system protein VirB6
MGFFATFWSWLNGQLTSYIGDNTARLASVLEPTMVTLATIYVMGWGYLHLMGKIEEPVVAGLKRVAMIALVLGAGLHLWLYNTVIVDTFYNAPAQLAAAVVGAGDPVATIDTIWDSGGIVASNLYDKGGHTWGVGFFLAGTIVYCLMGMLCVYAMFLIALSNIALAVLLALGPLFLAMLFFDATKRYFSAWLGQLANYALITVLTIMVAALLLHIVQAYAAQTAARGTAILTVDALNMILAAVLVFLVLRQIMPIAAGLVGGSSLSSHGFVGRTIAGGFGMARAAAKPAMSFGATHAARSVQTVTMRTGRVIRDAYGKAGAGAAALGRNWRNRRR